MSRFDRANKVRHLGIISTLVMLVGAISGNLYLLFAGMTLAGVLGTFLLCEQCSRIYLRKPLRWLLTGQGDGVCVKCEHRN
ncbi:hypothetical protein [Sphingopyxis witflariensis]|nr:hypothetical protein [Sphingopyxis witflariensis]